MKGKKEHKELGSHSLSSLQILWFSGCITQIQSLGWSPAHFKKVRPKLYIFTHKVGEKPSAGEVLVPRESQPSALTSVCASGQAQQLPCTAWSSPATCLPMAVRSPSALMACQVQHVQASLRWAVPLEMDPCSPLGVTGGYRDFPHQCLPYHGLITHKQ